MIQLNVRTDPQKMPAKNVVKTYIADGFYHAYNRGAGGQNIFHDSQDYYTFMYYLKKYISPINSQSEVITKSNSLNDEIQLLCFCLMPNHYHLLIRQFTRSGMSKLILKLCTSYAMYYNDKYQRSGTIFQGRYKAILVDEENYLLHLSRYIHINPTTFLSTTLSEYPYSSYSYYLGKNNADWVNVRPILSMFSHVRSPLKKKYKRYREFVESSMDSESILGRITLESDE